MLSRPIAITAPVVAPDESLWFSAYGFGWGYCAFALPVEEVCERLGAANTSTSQLKLAFELGRKRITQAIEQTHIPGTGDRVILNILG
jgi:hypothetical protein